MDKNCMSYWFPKIRDAGLPVPRTELVHAEDGAISDLYRVFDGKKIGKRSQPFLTRLIEAATRIGFPCFLRTGHTSGKHDWKNTCHVPDATSIPQHVINIMEYSELTQIMGLPLNQWAVRELLQTRPYGVCQHWGDMPVCREFRLFVKGGEVQCCHPYWPLHALMQGMRGHDEFPAVTSVDAIYHDLQQLTDHFPLHELAKKAGKAVGGEWSVDFLETENGWYLTDMAEAKRSYHWEGCGNA